MRHSARTWVLLGASVLALLLATGCWVRTQPVTVTASAPPPPAVVVNAQPAPPTSVVVSQPVATNAAANGVISYPGHRVRFPLSISYSRVVNVYVSGYGLDPVVTLYDAYGNQLGYNDDGGANLDSQLTIPLGPGSYVVEVGGYGDSTGSFNLNIQ